MTKEEKKHMEFIEAARNNNLKAFNHLVPYMANDYNPKYVQAVKGTPFEGMNSEERKKFGNILKDVYVNRYRDFAKAYKNLFGTGRETPFKDTPKVVFEDYMNDAIRAKKLAFREGYAEDWLKVRFAREVQLGGLKRT